jgi:hypothetical protein
LEAYVISLLASDLPFDAWFAALAWLALFFANYRVAQATRMANDAQSVLKVEDWNALRRGFEPKNIAAKIVFAAIVFLLASLLGGPAFVLLAGGFIVATAYGVGLNLQGLLSARAMAEPNAVSGSVTFTTASALRHMAQRAAGGALACLLMGLALAHLALLGGALFLAATAHGYVRRAEKIPSRG